MKAVILAGGGGTRLWPLSTSKKPKQFHSFLGEKTLFEEAVERLDFLDSSDIFIATNKSFADLVKKHNNILEENIILEPDLRDTASCIGYAASIIEKKLGKDEVMAVIYSDHFIKNKAEFQKALKIAEQIAKEENTLNIIEIPAESPNPNWGYVQIGEKWNEIDGLEIYKIKGFKEKPTVEKAKEFIASGDYLWNTGIYVWKASKLMEKFKELQPETYEKFLVMQNALGTSEEGKVVNQTYPTLEKISIDYAIMEKVKPDEIRIIKADIGLKDIGTFEIIGEEIAKAGNHDDNENVLKGEEIKLLDSKNSLIISENKRPIKAIGVEDLIIIDSPEGLLVCKKGESGKIKNIL